MSTTSTRLSIPIAALTDGADAHTLANQIVAAIDLIMAADYQGTLAARSGVSPTVQGRYYYATDTGGFYRSDGTAWQLINPFPTTDAAVGVGSLRTLGTGALQAAAGNDSRLSDTRTPSALSVVTSTIAAGAVTFAKMGFQNVITLQKRNELGSGLTTPGANFKAGHLLNANTDFISALGLAGPRLLLSMNGNVNDQSGAGVVITNTGSVVTTGQAGAGIDGTANTAAIFDGSTTLLTAPNTMKQKFGSWGCWFKTPKRGQVSGAADQTIFGMWQAASTDQSMRLVVEAGTGLLRADVSTTGGTLVGAQTHSTSIVDDGMWHFGMMTWDGYKLCVYVDGVLEGVETISPSIANVVGTGPAFQSAALLFSVAGNSNGGQRFEGKISNLFVTQDVLNEQQYRILYAKRFTHTLGTQPQLYALNVRKYARTKTYVAADFTGMSSLGTSIAQPLMGGNFENSGGSWNNDFGSLANSWSSSITESQVPQPWGLQGVTTQHGSVYLNGSGTSAARGSDTGLPSGAAPVLTYGVWVRCLAPASGVYQIWEYGTAAANAGRGLWVDSSGVLWAGQSGQLTTGACNYAGFADGQWHFVVVTELNSAGSTTLRKLYVDGQLVSCSSTALGTITLSGALGANLGCSIGNTNNLVGGIGGFFISGSFFADENVRDLYTKVDTTKIQFDRQPFDPMNCVEKADATAIYFIGDDLEPTDYLELYAA